MLIQPLVENAVTHGIEPCMRGGHIMLSARAIGDNAVQVTISDTGIGVGHGSGKGSGLGITHVRERLARIFGAAASMQMEENAPRGVVVRLTLPVTRQAEAPAPAIAPAGAASHGTPAVSTPAMQRP